MRGGSPLLPPLQRRDVASSLQHGAGGRLLTASGGIYATLLYLFMFVRKGFRGWHLQRNTSPFRGGCIPPHSPPFPLPTTTTTLPRDRATPSLQIIPVATCMRGKKRKTCSWHELWKRSWPTRRWRRLTIPSCAKPARWLWVSSVLSLASPGRVPDLIDWFRHVMHPLFTYY